MDSNRMMTAAEMREKLIGKATRDGEFRPRLIADPKGAIETEWGVKLPDGFNLEVHQETEDTAHLVLPPPSKLSEAELLAVAGGQDSRTNWQNRRQVGNNEWETDW